MGWRVIAEPVAEPLSLAQAKAWARFDPDPHPLDAIIESILIPAARKACQDYTGRSFGKQTLRLVLDRFPVGGVLLPRPPAVDVLAVEYVDPAGVARVLASASYYLDDTQEPGWLLPAYGTAWPVTRDQANAVRVTYLAGAEATPEPVLHAMALQVTAGIENPSEVSERQTYRLAAGVEALLQPFVVYTERVPRIEL